MWVVVIGLTALVLLLARKAPNANAGDTTTLGPDLSLPALGADANSLSPASSNGSPFISQQNGIRLGMSYQMAESDGKLVSSMTPDRMWQRRRGVQLQGNYLTDAQSNMRTQDVPALTDQVNPGDVEKL